MGSPADFIHIPVDGLCALIQVVFFRFIVNRLIYGFFKCGIVPGFKNRAQIQLFVGMEARLQLAICRQPDFIAAAAEMIAHGADETDSAYGIRIFVILGNGVFGWDGQDTRKSIPDFGIGHVAIAPVILRMAYGHELDESHIKSLI
jgi:hypothetical protein